MAPQFFFFLERGVEPQKRFLSGVCVFFTVMYDVSTHRRPAQPLSVPRRHRETSSTTTTTTTTKSSSTTINSTTSATTTSTTTTTISSSTSTAATTTTSTILLLLLLLLLWPQTAGQEIRVANAS